ncbi:MAG: hypothetical protein V1799_08970 [bacterium]
MAENKIPEKIIEAGAVESVVIALHKVIDLLDRIKTTIEESSNKIPRAAVQLHTVTQATEMATVEIMNVLDTMTHKFTSLESELSTVRGMLASEDGNVIIDSIESTLTKVKQDITNIMMALQVQDITAQKIAAANHLIESVRKEIIHELNYFESSEKDAIEEAIVRKPAEDSEDQAHHFDKNASFRKSAEHQERIDKVVQQWREKQSDSDSKE